MRRLAGLEQAGHIAVLVSPMLSCEDAWHIATLARAIDGDAVLAVGPVPFDGEDQTFPGGYTIRAEKAPNARGVRRVLSAFGDTVLEADAFHSALTSDAPIAGVLLTGNYPSEWATPAMRDAIGDDRFVVLLDTVHSAVSERADVFMPAATWLEKAGTFENANGRLQTFERAIEPLHYCKNEAQLALDLQADLEGCASPVFNAIATRQTMADAGLDAMLSEVHLPQVAVETLTSDMAFVQLGVFRWFRRRRGAEAVADAWPTEPHGSVASNASASRSASSAANRTAAGNEAAIEKITHRKPKAQALGGECGCSRDPTQHHTDEQADTAGGGHGAE